MTAPRTSCIEALFLAAVFSLCESLSVSPFPGTLPSLGLATNVIDFICVL